MSAQTKIEWTDRTVNPIRARNTSTGKVGHFCVHVSEGCRHCYAERWQSWRGTGLKDSYRQSTLDTGKIELFLDEKVLLAPLGWRKPCRVFWGDMTDLFGEWVPDAWLDRMAAVVALTPHLTHQWLTKRSKRMRDYFAEDKRGGYMGTRGQIAEAAYKLNPSNQRAKSLFFVDGSAPWPLPNLHLGVSAEDQATADDRIPDLLDTSAAVRFVSVEPLLGAVKLHMGQVPDSSPIFSGNHPDGVSPGLDWVIVGGESGSGARPMDIEWARSLRDQCRLAGVPFFLKQIPGNTPPSRRMEDRKNDSLLQRA